MRTAGNTSRDVARGAATVHLAGVGKDYGAVRAVDTVDLRVGPGEVYALLGLNGAGKTTLIRMVLGMVAPSRGSVEVLGHRVSRSGPWVRVGHLVESPAAYPQLTVRENLEVARRLRRLPSSAYVADAIERFGLAAYADRRAGTLSLGNLQRLGLAKALLHHPALVVLDEPVNGLDPAGVVEVREMLATMAREEGMTVLLSSHLLSEVSRLATRIGVLHRGRMVEEIPARALGSRLRRRMEVRTTDDRAAIRALLTAGFEPTVEPAADRDVPGAPGGRRLVLSLPRDLARIDEVAPALVRAAAPPVHMAVEEEDLESYFLRLVGAEPATPRQEVVHVA